MVEFKYLKDHGNHKKGDITKMVKSTAAALVVHKVGVITKEFKAPKEKPKGKAGVISKK